MLRLVSRHTTPAVSLEEMVDHLRRTDTEEDDFIIERFVIAAERWVENFTGLALVDQTWDYYFDSYPASNIRFINIPKPPLIEVEGVFYRDGSEATFSDYLIDYASHPSRIFLSSSSSSWPTTDGALYAGRIRFRAGYVDESSSPPTQGEIPEDIKAAIQIYAATLYEQREIDDPAALSVRRPWGAEQLLRMYRVENSLA